MQVLVTMDSEWCGSRRAERMRCGRVRVRASERGGGGERACGAVRRCGKGDSKPTVDECDGMRRKTKKLSMSVDC
jgi:hypothetical protein